MNKVTEIMKNYDEIIRISMEQYRGHEFVNIRQYYKDNAGEFKPTKKGITLHPELIDEVIEGLQLLKIQDMR